MSQIESYIRKAEVREVIDLYYHLVDEIDVSGLRQVFSEDCLVDITDFGGGVRHGIEEILASLGQPAPRLVRGHMGTNTLIELDGEEASSVTKCIAMLEGGVIGGAIHSDRLRKTADGWRIYRRVISMFPQLKA